MFSRKLRTAYGMGAGGGLRRDLRYAIRSLRRTPGFTLVAIVSLALGIGANTAIFSVVNGVVLTSPPYGDPNRLVVLWTVPPHHPEDYGSVSVPQYVFWKRASRSFQSMGAIDIRYTVNLGAAGEIVAERIDGHRCSAAMFRTLAVQPELGRYYTDDEDQPGASPVAVISDRLWKRRFRSDPKVLGTTLRMDGVKTTIIGVMPPGFGGPLDSEDPDFFIPFAFTNTQLQGRVHWIVVAARLKPGMTVERAQAEMKTLFAAFAQAHPDRDKGWGVRVESIETAAVGWLGRILLVLQVAVGFVLLIACSNVAGLMLARASSRRKEIAIRSALGGGRWQIARQMLAESLLLALCGGAAGVSLAFAGLRPLIAISPDWFPRLQSIVINWHVLGFTAAVSLVTGLVFGIAPAFQSAKSGTSESLKDGGRGATAGQGHHRVRSALVIIELALAVVLLIGAGLTVNSFLRLQRVDYGCDPKGLMTFQVRLPRTQYVKETGIVGGFPTVDVDPAVPVFFNSVLRSVAGIPGVEAAAGSTYIPLGGAPSYSFVIEGHGISSESEAEANTAAFYPVTAKYFAAMKIPLLRGRAFTPQDNAAGPWVAVISQTMARRYWPGADPIGRRFTITGANVGEQPREVVGVVGDVRRTRRDRELRPAVYIPQEQQLLHTQGRFVDNMLQMTFVLRTPGNATRLSAAIRDAVARVDRNQPVFEIRTEEQFLDLQVQDSRYYMLLLAVFACVALALAAVGIYGLVAYAVTQRTNEIGIRMALGATAGSVLRMVLRQGTWLIAVGLGLGLAASSWLTRFLQAQLWGVTPTDTDTFIGISVILAATALAACVVPARRASRVDPMVALRHE